MQRIKAYCILKQVTMRFKKRAQRLKRSGETRFFLSLMERKPGYEVELFHPQQIRSYITVDVCLRYDCHYTEEFLNFTITVQGR